MKQLTMKLKDLVRPERNIRIHTEKQLEEFERSVRMFGQIRPIVVDENNTILAGNGLYETLLRMNWEEAKVCKLDGLTENQKKKLMIADNRIYSLGVDNLEAMTDILSELDGDVDVPGFDEEMLKQMMADEDEITEVLSEYGKLDEDEIAMVHERAERKEVAMQKEPVKQVSQESGDDAEVTLVEKVYRSDRTPISDNEKKEMQKSIICPKCGERIWL